VTSCSARPKPRPRRYPNGASGIESTTMSASVRVVRTLISALLALVMLLASSTSGAQELRGMPAPRTGVTAGAPKLEASPIATPRDVPLVSPSEVTIPPVPSTYITRDLGWLELSFPSAASERVESLLKDAAAVKAQLADVLGQPVLDRIEVRITPTFEDMRMLAPVGAPPPAYASGVAYPKLHLVLISMLAPRGADATNLDDVFRHELAHVALEDAVLGQHVPAWFNEGLAVGFAGENSIDRQKVMATATINGTLLPLADLDRGFPVDQSDVNVAYAESVSFLSFLQARSDHLRFASTIQRVREGQAFDRALGDAYGSDLRKLEYQWRSEVERRYSLIPVLAGGGILWVGVIGALGWGFVKKRRRTKAILARWAEDEAIEDALLAQRAREAAEAAELSDGDLMRLSMRSRAPAKVEHEGNWHTLH
jgi:peptidase MA superfamily protein